MGKKKEKKKKKQASISQSAVHDCSRFYL